MDITQAEYERRRSEASLAQAQKVTPTGSLWWKMSTGEIVWSEESCRLLEYPPTVTPSAELILKRCHPDDRPLVQETIARSVREGTNMDYKHRLLMPDGSIKHVHVLVQKVGAGSGELEFVGTVTDITAQSRTEADLADALARVTESEDQLRTLIDTIPGHAWTTGPNGEGEFFSRRWLDYAGMSMEEVRGAGWADAIHPDDVGAMVENWRKIVASKRPGEQEARLRRFDGEYRWFLFRGAPLLDPSGKVVKWYGTNTDIDDLKRAEKFLAGEKRLFEMMATGQSLQVTLDALCRIVEELADGALASILLLDEDGSRLRHCAAPSLPSSYTEAIDGAVIGPSAGSCGTAAYRGEKVFVADIASDPLWADYRDLALAHDLRACWSTPILSANRAVLGTFAIYSRQARSITPAETRITEQFTHLASIVVERKRAEDALRQSESFLAEGQKIGRMGSWAWNLASDKLVWSDEHCRIFGYRLDEGGGTFADVLARMLPEERALVQAAVAEDVHRGQDFDFEYRITMADGTIKHLQSVGRAVVNDSGEAGEYIGTTIDITDRKRAEKELRMLASLIENSSDFIGYAPSIGPVGFLNAAGRKLVGLSLEEDISKYHISDFRPAEDHRYFLEEVRPILERDGQWVGERSLRNFQTGAVIPVLQTIFFITEKGSDRQVGIATICRDITERKKNEEALRRVHAELAHVSRVTTMGELTASIAHEVNQPLTGIVIGGNASLRWLSADSPDLDEARKAIQRVIRDGKRAGEVIARIRTLFKKDEPVKERLDLNDVIQEVIVLTRNELHRNNVALHMDLEGSLPSILGDRVQLQQVLMNLILNAIEAMQAVEDRSRTLTIRTAAMEGNQVCIEVRDTGGGVDPNDADRIFATFHTTKPGGMGMGLSICRSIVENHGGRLQVVAHAGDGATFRFTLSQDG